MTGSVSTRWIRVVAVVSLAALATAVLSPVGSPWAGALEISLALTAVVWVHLRSRRSITEIIRNIDVESAATIGDPRRPRTPATKAH